MLDAQKENFMHPLTRIALVGTSPSVAARVRAALAARGSARDAVAKDCDPVALVGPVGSPLTYTDSQESRNARQAMAYREMMSPGMVPLVGSVGLDAAGEGESIRTYLGQYGYRQVMSLGSSTAHKSGGGAIVTVSDDGSWSVTGVDGKHAGRGSGLAAFRKR